MPNFKRYTKGQSLQRLSAGDMNRRADVLEGLQRSNVFGGMAGPFGMGTSGRAISTNEPGAWFLLTGEAGSGNYTGTELRDDATTETAIVNVKLREVNGVTGIDISESSGDDGTTVWAVRGDQNGSGDVEWLFEYKPPTPFPTRLRMFTSSGTWTVPDGVTHVWAWIIGGGAGGSAGAIGEDIVTVALPGGGSTTLVRGGTGGRGGGGGSGIIALLDVSFASSYDITIGAGGTAGVAGGAAATNGGDTDFDGYATLTAAGGRAAVSANTYGNGGSPSTSAQDADGDEGVGDLLVRSVVFGGGTGAEGGTGAVRDSIGLAGIPGEGGTSALGLAMVGWSTLTGAVFGPSYGAGGRGGYGSQTSGAGATDGENGHDGVVILWY